MHGHYILPVGLLTLLFSSLALAQQPTPVPVSPNDPFRDIAKLAQPQPEPPVCCLKPLASNEPTEELLVSFEEWKERQERTLRERQGNEGKDGAAKTKKPATPSNTLAEPPEGEIEHEDIHNQDKQPLAAPAHFRVPITDRFNFASSDCSARVHYAHNSARSVSSLLSSKKDRYMLSPCNTPENKYIVVELCDFIRIDTVQLANFEFFSGVFKDFTIHVAPAYDENLENWTFAGIYRARNIRGIQVKCLWLNLNLASADGGNYYVDFPARYFSLKRLLSIHPHRLPLTLRERILLSNISLTSIWLDRSRAMEVGNVGEGVQRETGCAREARHRCRPATIR